MISVTETLLFSDKIMRNNKIPGTDRCTTEFYRYFWHEIADIMVDGFNYGFQASRLSISQRQGIISLIPKNNIKSLEYLKNWQPLSLLKTDYKIATKTLACRLEKNASYAHWSAKKKFWSAEMQ